MKSGPKVKVVTYKGERAAQKGISKMLGDGWELEGQSSRKEWFNLTTGIFTGKQNGVDPTFL